MAALDKHYMGLALKLAEAAFDRDEVPVGAVLVVEGKLVGWGSNDRARHNAVTGHAEIMALQVASEQLANWRFLRSTLYVTLEPCIMCAGACLQARVDRLVFACRDPKAGAIRSLYALGDDPRLPHRMKIDEGIFAVESAKLLSDFFEKLRNK